MSTSWKIPENTMRKIADDSTNKQDSAFKSILESSLFFLFKI